MTVTGGTGTTFGQWIGGTITIGDGNLTFDGGNTFLADNISASGGLGMVTNKGVLQLTGPQSITGSFTQTGAGVLDLGIAGNAFGQYGALEISAAASLDGGLGLDLLNGFSLALGDKFDVLSFSSLSGAFDALSLDGEACAAQTADVWRCNTNGESWYLTETIGGSGLYQQYVSVTAETTVTEPSTVGLLAMGFASLAGWRWRIGQHPGLHQDNIPIPVSRDRTGATVDAVLPQDDSASIGPALTGVVTRGKIRYKRHRSRSYFQYLSPVTKNLLARTRKHHYAGR